MKAWRIRSSFGHHKARADTREQAIEQAKDLLESSWWNASSWSAVDEITTVEVYDSRKAP